MPALENLENRLKEITRSEWEQLFQLISEMEKADSFGEVKGGKEIQPGVHTMPYMHPDKVVVDFFRIANGLDIIPVFDWMNWRDGQNLLNDKERDYSTLSAIELCKLLTVIIRTDRYSEGYLVACFENGIILKILRGLQYHIFG